MKRNILNKIKLRYLAVLGCIVLIGACTYLLKPAAPIQGEMWELDQAGDLGLRAYVQTVLWKRCPFYQPDGVGYRQCLQNALEETRATYKGKESTQEVESYCESLGSQFEGLPAGEFIVSCKAYKYSIY